MWLCVSASFGFFVCVCLSNIVELVQLVPILVYFYCIGFIKFQAMMTVGVVCRVQSVSVIPLRDQYFSLFQSYYF